MCVRRLGGSTIAIRTQVAPKEQPIVWDRVLIVVACAAFLIAVIRAVLYYLSLDDPAHSVGIDFNLYAAAARRWLSTGQFYAPFQLAGPYQVIGAGEVLYPPVLLLLLVPFLVVPGLLWWLVPVALTVVAIARMRPAPWSLAVIGTLCTTHAVQAPLFWGTPVIWLVPAVAWGFLLGWPAAFVLLKPTLAPFALAGLPRPRAFLLGVAVLAIVSIAFFPLWIDWLTAIRNSNLGPFYAWTQSVLLALPVVAWLGGRSGVPAAVRWIEQRTSSPR